DIYQLLLICFFLLFRLLVQRRLFGPARREDARPRLLAVLVRRRGRVKHGILAAALDEGRSREEEPQLFFLVLARHLIDPARSGAWQRRISHLRGADIHQVVLIMLAVEVIVGLAAIAVQLKLAEPAVGGGVLIDGRRRTRRFRLVFRFHVGTFLSNEREGEDHQGGDGRCDELSHAVPPFLWLTAQLLT